MKKLIVAGLFSLCSVAYAACDNLYPNNTPIKVENTVELCNSFFVSLYDVQHSAVILVSERLVKGSVGSATRLNAFRSDPRAPRVTNKDYAGTGYDKGHMAPAGDASNNQEMYETFFLTNMTPQKPFLNREAWKRLEDHVRKEALKSPTDTYVLTVAIYNKPEYMKGKVPIPSGYWKIVMTNGTTKYYFAENKDYAQVEVNSGIDVAVITKPNW